ncbi:MAG: hypothetical protein ABSH46_12780 [Bryobacteraceae bacterium]|jgi:uncharacterized coiled-coil protein SlyX
MQLRLLCAFVTLTFTLPCFAQSDVDTLRQQIAAQQKQIEDLQRTLDAQQKALEKLTAAPAIAPAPAPAQPPEGATVSAPLSFKIGDAEFTPGGFMDLTSIFRTTNVGSGIGTSFNGIPFNNTVAGVSSENRFSAQNSRLALKMTSTVLGMPVIGYVETDFLGVQPANPYVTSNAMSLRLRLYWVDVTRGKLEILGGQSWSLLTPGRTGISPNPSDIFYSQDMDTNYQVGLVWTRAPQFRVVYHATKDFAAAVSLENPEQYIGAATTVPSLVGSQLDNNATTSTPNYMPDVQSKIAYDAKAGGRQVLHIEAAGLFRTFRIANTNLSKSTIHGAGGEVNAILEPVKNFRLIETAYYSSGGGRYIGNTGAPDVVVRANGNLSPVHSGSGIGGFEAQVAPKLMLYGYYSVAYIQKNWGFPASGSALLGYGFPGSANSNNRVIGEGTGGFIYSFWKNPKYGALQWINQYSYLYREPWATTPAIGGPVKAHTNMVYTDLRYVLP